jgi:hypothetical protein
LRRRSVSEQELAQFRSDPLCLQGKLFLHVASDSNCIRGGGCISSGGGSDHGGGSSNGLCSTIWPSNDDSDEPLDKVIGYLFPASVARIVLQFAGCQSPDQRPAEVVFNLIAHSMLVEV